MTDGPLTNRFAEALVWAFELHAGQLRKGTDVPYVAHVLSVAALALEHGADEETAIAALLHDAVEDQGGEAVRQEVCRRFGPRVASIVSECSDTDEVPKPPWRARKERHLAEMATASPEAALVMAADKVHNLRTVIAQLPEVGGAIWSRFKAGREGTFWYYRSAAEALHGRIPEALQAELDHAIVRAEDLANCAPAAG